MDKTFIIFKPDQTVHSFQTVVALPIVYVTFKGTKCLQSFIEEFALTLSKPQRISPQEHNGR